MNRYKIKYRFESMVWQVKDVYASSLFGALDSIRAGKSGMLYISQVSTPKKVMEDSTHEETISSALDRGTS